MPRNPQITHDLRKTPKNGHDKWSSRLEMTKRGNLTWTDCGADDLLAAVAAATDDGAALLLSRTSDGGALVIQVFTAGGTHKLYPASMEELNEALRLIVEVAQAD